VRKHPAGSRYDAARAEERAEVQIPATVEHPFNMVKNLLCHDKMRSRAGQEHCAVVQLVRANLVLARRLLASKKRNYCVLRTPKGSGETWQKRRETMTK